MKWERAGRERVGVDVSHITVGYLDRVAMGGGVGAAIALVVLSGDNSALLVLDLVTAPQTHLDYVGYARVADGQAAPSRVVCAGLGRAGAPRRTLVSRHVREVDGVRGSGRDPRTGEQAPDDVTR